MTRVSHTQPDCEPRLKIAVIATNAGAPGTLASTAFIGAILDGFAHVGIQSRVVGLARDRAAWHPEVLETFDTSAPWLASGDPRCRDLVAAARLGVLDQVAGAEPAGVDGRGWYLELLLQRELQDFASGDDVAIVAYPRSYEVLRTVWRIAERCRWRVIVSSTEALSDTQIDPATRDDYVRGVVEHGDGVWALSDHLASYWQAQGVSEGRILVQPPAVRESSFAHDAPPRTATAAYIGNLQHREIEYLLDVSESVRRRLPAFRLTIHGDSTEDRRGELAQAISDRGLSRVISIEHAVPPTEVPAVLKRADVLVLPRSQGEFSEAGFPNKLGEYLASGRPVVVTRVGDIPKYLVDGESAFLVEPDDCDAFADALARALSDTDLADRIGANGQSVAARLLASSKVASRLVEFIRGLPSPRPQNTGSRVWRHEAAFIATELQAGARLRTRTAARALLYTRSGHTRVVALKMGIVRMLRALRLKPPAPGE